MLIEVAIKCQTGIEAVLLHAGCKEEYEVLPLNNL